MLTSAPTPAATRHALSPAMPPPITATLPDRTPGRAAQQHAAPAVARLQTPGADLDRDASRDLAHRREQRKTAILQLDGFIAEAR